MILICGKNNFKIKRNSLNIKYTNDKGKIIEEAVNANRLFDLYVSCEKAMLFELLDNQGNYLEFIIEDIENLSEYLINENSSLNLYLYCSDLEKTPIISTKKELKEIDKRNVCVIKEEITENTKLKIISFPKNWTRKMQQFWLRKNKYPIVTEYYNFTYDCFLTQYLACFVKYKKNIVSLYWYSPEDLFNPQLFNKKFAMKIIN